MRALRPLVLAAALAGPLLSAVPAAAESCVGTDEVFFACVRAPVPYESSITQCVYTGGPTCEDVTVPFVWVSGGADARCETGYYVPEQAMVEPPCRWLDAIDVT